MKITDQDRQLLGVVQREVDLSLADLSERVGMAPSTVWRKLQDLTAAGVISKKVALLSPQLLDVKLLVLASVSLEDHMEATVEGFVKTVRAQPEILECLKVTGGFDYILKVRVSDVEAYETFMTHQLLRSPYVRSVQSTFVLKEVKATTELPL